MATKKKPANGATCELCEANRNQYCPTCLMCGGRYLRAIADHLGVEIQERRVWWGRARKDWVAAGHPKDALTALARKGCDA